MTVWEMNSLGTEEWNITVRDGRLLDRVMDVIHKDQFFPNPQFPDRFPAPFKSEGFADGNLSNTLSEQDHAAHVMKFCYKLYDAISKPDMHMSRLDHNFSKLLRCSFHLTCSESPFRHSQASEIVEDIARQTLELLGRLPKVPPKLPGLPTGIECSFFSPSTASTDSNASSWENLNVATYLDVNVIRFAICITVYPWISLGVLSELINDVAMLIDHATHSFSDAETPSERRRWYLVRAFLWSSWQRKATLYFSLLLARHLRSGVADDDARRQFLRSFSPVPGISIQEMSKRCANLDKSQYMCSWAFELLRNHPVCLGLDFRRMHRLYSKQFDGYSARCNLNSRRSCEGSKPRSCQRFVGLIIKDQSAHDSACTGCERLIWDENSFRSTTAARAVSLEATSNTRLRYRTASKNTLAISHVWSHGQGGRPETGMNACLHQRYKSIAKSMGCDSYWMDTPCIPTDHVLRREAILHINGVFAGSKATLVCDRDLMEIDISGNDTVELREIILLTTITCDWNIRAWTFLEAFRARQSIHLLCRNNKTLSLRESVEIVHRDASLDIVILLLTIPHLLPRVHRVQEESAVLKEKYPRSWEIFRWYPDGFLTVENSGKFLSHRPASRSGDEIVIWSLLLQEKVYENAVDFWRSRQGSYVHTTFLVSTAPRVKIWRLGWAPVSPNIFSPPSAQTKALSMGFNDTGSELGEITSDGLKARWLFYQMGRSKRAVAKIPFSERMLPFSNIRLIWKTYLLDYKWGALARAEEANTVMDPYPAPNREDVSSVLVVICGTNDSPSDDVAWEWKGVYEWDSREPLPKFTSKSNVLFV